MLTADNTGVLYNFSPGPAALPHEVLQQIQLELLDFAGTGMSVIIHLSKLSILVN